MKIDQNFKNQLKQYIIDKIREKEKRSVIIASPYQINNEQMELFYQQFPYLKDAVIETQIDKGLIGGFVIKFGTTVFDASIKGKINNLVNKLYESS